MTINYELKFFDYWHVSSGLSGGAALDSYVIKDSAGLPYVPGKTIKGLVREAAELFWDQGDIDKCFGSRGGKGEQKNNDDTTQAQCYFSSATIDEKIAAEITSNKLERNLFEIISATKIDENGIVADKSLRDIEVVLPITLIGKIENIDDKFA
ncbi:RAMP superfamily CRISPR-associated protein [uncultured Campylobacter sp.]|uniref:RAMP superfamily CRISPR-associated protein n=1 Tax=uncultured Campylobacter sp. TaxID=218934 RepID=UPI002620F1CE|nr:RAMP superfamily CRISPR-associated protein [uncultured Campylobacter sp.]